MKLMPMCFGDMLADEYPAPPWTCNADAAPPMDSESIPPLSMMILPLRSMRMASTAADAPLGVVENTSRPGVSFSAIVPSALQRI